jgi:hypothetical protein
MSSISDAEQITLVQPVPGERWYAHFVGGTGPVMDYLRGDPDSETRLQPGSFISQSECEGRYLLSNAAYTVVAGMLA